MKWFTCGLNNFSTELLVSGSYANQDAEDILGLTENQGVHDFWPSVTSCHVRPDNISQLLSESQLSRTKHNQICF